MAKNLIVVSMVFGTFVTSSAALAEKACEANCFKSAVCTRVVSPCSIHRAAEGRPTAYKAIAIVQAENTLSCLSENGTLTKIIQVEDPIRIGDTGWKDTPESPEQIQLEICEKYVAEHLTSQPLCPN